MNLITTIEGMADAIDEIKKSKFISVDVETTGLDMVDDELVGIGFGTKDDEWYFDLDTYVKDYETEKQTKYDLLHKAWELMVVKRLFDMELHIFIAHNAPFDLWLLYRDVEKYTSHPSKVYDTLDNCLDTLSMATVVDENLVGTKIRFEGALQGALKLKSLARIFLNREPKSWDEGFMDEWTIEERAEYCAADVRNTYDLAVLFSQVLKDRGMYHYYRKYVAPMSFVTLMMEKEGIRVDIPKLLEVKEDVDIEIKKYIDELANIVSPEPERVFRASEYKHGTSSDVRDYFEDLVGLLEDDYDIDEFYTASGNLSVSASNLEVFYEEFPDEDIWDEGIVSYQEVEYNPNSRQQLIDYFLDKGYSLPMTTKGNYSVNEAALDELEDKYPDDVIWEPLTKRRRLHKLKNTYVDNILSCAWEDERVHPQWNQAGTVTGRYSCSSGQSKSEHPRGPAMQTIPRPSTIKEAGWDYNPREWFIAREGHTMAVADYAQAEVRMLAVMSNDSNLIGAIRAGEDMHSEIAAQVFADQWEESDDEERKMLRQQCKMVTFGTMYGIGPSSLSERLDISYSEAGKILDDFYSAFPQVAEWKKKVAFGLNDNGYVESFFGRRRSPIFSQYPPRITAKPHTDRYDRQNMHYQLWEMEMESESKRSHIDLSDADDAELRGRAVRQAVNFLIQGSVADLLNLGLVKLVRKGYKVIGQIHDEVVLEFMDNPEKVVENDIKAAFEYNIEDVPFTMDVHFGDSWACGKD